METVFWLTSKGAAAAVAAKQRPQKITSARSDDREAPARLRPLVWHRIMLIAEKITGSSVVGEIPGEPRANTGGRL
jgi:hypothetical protein